MEARTVTDLASAAYLLSIGYKEILPREFKKGRTLVLYFEACPKLEDDLNSYYAGTARVDPLTFTDHLTLLRQRLRREREAFRIKRDEEVI